MEVTLDDFLFHVEWLSANRDVVSLTEALDRWQEDHSDQLVVLTFDDGYEDTYTTAFPILLEAGFSFTLYVASDQVERASKGDGATGSLNWGQIQEMVDSGIVTLGAHTHTHADLRTIPSDAIESELATCDDLIAERTGVVPEHFAYPWGYWSAHADAIVRARYRSAVLGGSPESSRPLDPHRIPRFPVQRSDGARFFEGRLEGGFLLEERVRRRIRGYRGP